jgi:hypothetical protein
MFADHVVDVGVGLDGSVLLKTAELNANGFVDVIDFPQVGRAQHNRASPIAG